MPPTTRGHFPLCLSDGAPKASDEESTAIIEQYRRILNSAVETAIITVDAHGAVTGWSAGAQRLLGWAEHEMLGKSLSLIFPDGQNGSRQWAHELSIAAATGTGGAEGWRRRKDGKLIWAVGETKPMSENDPSRGFVKVLRDRTAQRETETILRARTRALEILNRASTSLARETDLEKVVQLVTDAGVALTGAEFGAFFYNVTDAAGQSYMLYSISGAPPERFSKFPMPRNTAVFSPTFNGEGIIRSDDITLDPRYGKNTPNAGMPAGHLPVRSYLAVPVISRDGNVIGGLFFGHSTPGVFTDDSERNLTGLAGEAAVAIDNVRLFEAMQREIAERSNVEAALRDLNTDLEEQVRRRTEELVKNAETLRQSQKMEALGQLTGGIAHDFNNLLQVIVGNLDILTLGLPDNLPRLRRSTDLAKSGAMRAATLTQRLLAFARKQPLAPRPLDANAVIHGMAELLRRALGETIKLESVGAGELWATEADLSELENVLLNLAVNARDAMPDGGKLTIETSNGYLDEAYAARHGEVSPGQYVLISVTDTGVGMDEKVLARVFEPFFTTKEEGKGSGLGLSQVYGFVKQSGGHVKLYSERGRGTTVKLYLPRFYGDLHDPVLHNFSSAPVAAGETVLVVEDDRDVRAFAVTALQELGYHVIESVDGPSAIEVLKRTGVDLLLSDVGLPGGLTGLDVVTRAKEIQPGLKALLTTGYARNALIHNDRLDPSIPVITKPFSLDELAKKVRDVLDLA